jgi:hypothetical protein
MVLDVAADQDDHWLAVDMQCIHMYRSSSRIHTPWPGYFAATAIYSAAGQLYITSAAPPTTARAARQGRAWEGGGG